MGTIRTKKMMLKVIGLTTFPNNKLSPSQARLKGVNNEGIKIVISATIIARITDVIAIP
jgi:hypothetical protein